MVDIANRCIKSSMTLHNKHIFKALRSLVDILIVSYNGLNPTLIQKVIATPCLISDRWSLNWKLAMKSKVILFQEGCRCSTRHDQFSAFCYRQTTVIHTLLITFIQHTNILISLSPEVVWHFKAIDCDHSFRGYILSSQFISLPLQSVILEVANFCAAMDTLIDHQDAENTTRETPLCEIKHCLYLPYIFHLNVFFIYDNALRTAKYNRHGSIVTLLTILYIIN